MRKLIPFCLLFIVFWFAVYLWAWYFKLTLPVAPKHAQVSPQIIYIPPRTPFNQIAKLLHEKGLIRSPFGFTLEAWRLKLMDKLKAGEYELDPRMTPKEILQVLAEGKIITYLITIPEGYNLEEIAHLIAKTPICTKEEFLALTHDQKFLKTLKVPADSAEGFIFPDTYAYYRGLSCRALVTKMIRHFWEVWEEFQPRAQELNLDVLEVVTLASIVEKEAMYPGERPLIAGVFWNRLKRGMPLQADPTVRYALKKFKRRLRHRDLRVKNPYNTYVYTGLPPGPICSPGRDSIRAVLYPEKTDYLYFVAKGDGTHYFSKTLKEHQRAINLYRRKRHLRKRTPAKPRREKAKPASPLENIGKEAESLLSKEGEGASFLTPLLPNLPASSQEHK